MPTWTVRGLLAVAGAFLVTSAAFAAAPTLSTYDWPGQLHGDIYTRPQPVIVGYPFRYSFTSYSSPVTSYDAQGLPPGLSVDKSAGVISGTPTAAGSYPIVLSATNADGTTKVNVTLTVAPTPTQAPVIQPLPDLDTYYAGDGAPVVPPSVTVRPLSGIGEELINATNNPTSYGATNLPATLDTSFGYFSFDYNKITPGVYHVTISATNPAGTGSTTFTWTAHAAIAYMDAASTTYHAGDTITYHVTFSSPVVVTGTPYLSVANGTGRALYVSGSGTTDLVFKYPVPALATSITEYPPGRIEPNGGTITSNGVAAVLTQQYVRFDPVQPYTIAATPAVPSVPVVSNASVTGQVGTALTPVQVTATNSPTNFSAPGLSTYGLQISAGGVITGTPTVAANGIDVPVTATNSAGASSAANIHLTIADAPVVNPPPVNPPPVNPPPVSSQTITFSSPVSAIIVGQPITLGAISSAGLPITYTVVSGDATISGNTLTPTSTAPLVIRAAAAGNASYAAASTDVNFGSPQKAAQAITVASTGGDVLANTPVALQATTSSGLPVTFTVISGPATINGDTLTFTGTGAVTVRISQPGSATYAAANDVTLAFTAHPIPRLINVSSRVHVAAGESGIAGFVVTGSAPKRILVRAVGDSLAAFGVNDPLANPRLTLFDHQSTALASNAGWAGDAQIAAAGTSVGAFELTPGKTDAALIATLAPGAYSAQVTASGSGTVLIEAYDLGANEAVPTKQLLNVSTRAHVDARNSLIEGFVIAGDQPKRVLVRAVGPGLAPYGVTDAVANPQLAIYSGQTIVAQNDDWGTQQAPGAGQPSVSEADVAAASASTGAFALSSGSKDAAVLLTLAPGAYTAVVNGSATSTGEVLVEVYEVP